MYEYACSNCGEGTIHPDPNQTSHCENCGRNMVLPVVPGHDRDNRHRGMIHNSKDIPVSSIGQMILGPQSIDPTQFRELVTYDNGIYVYQILYTFAGRTSSVPKIGDTPVLKIHYTSGMDVIFTENQVVECSHSLGRDRGLGGSVYGVTLTIKCSKKQKFSHDNIPANAWKKIADSTKPDLFVVQDWRMDLSLVKVRIRHNLDGNPMVYLKVEKEENDSFGQIAGDPVLYLEYPEGNFTFQTTHIYINSTVKIDGKSWVPYEFQVNLTKSVLK